jgi:gamma-glutamylcyclotransferase (GGCT)/AIG2-like uncharacterized protein YtfP
MNNDIYALFVYGSLRSGFQHPAFKYISEYFEFVSKATIKGLLADMGEYPAATPTTNDLRIIGELYTIKNKDEFAWAFAQLDDYEGVHADEGEEPLFIRSTGEVLLENNSTTTAWVYWYNRSVDGYPVIESGDVLEYLQQKLNK